MLSIEPVLNAFLVFVLILTRLSGLLLTVPFFGAGTVPMRVRLLLTVGMALLLTPLYWTVPVENPGNLVNFAVILGQEAVLGLAMGLGILILFSGLQLTGQVIGQMSGMQLADVFNPTANASVSLFSQLLDLLTLAVFLTMGGHRQVIQALLDTFAWMPPGQVAFSENLILTLSEITSQSFVLGIRAAAPIMIALLLSVLILGLISRTLPQLNVIAVGFSLNSMVMLGMLSISLGGAAYLFQEQADVTFELIRDAVLSGLE